MRFGPATVAIGDDDTSLTCRLAGEVDLANSGEIFAAIARALSGTHHQLLLDLTDVTYVDSAGLALLVDINMRLTTRRTALRVVAPPGSPAQRILALCGLDTLLDLTDPRLPHGETGG
jgi:anti-anti-sigma factor